jgi:NADH-quinone oxidoreductase subunit H
MLPMTLINILDAGIWHFMPAGILRWIVCAAVILIPFALFTRGAQYGKKLQVRTYRYAE